MEKIVKIFYIYGYGICCKNLIMEYKKDELIEIEKQNFKNKNKEKYRFTIIKKKNKKNLLFKILNCN